jgi:RNA binding exosome subunit
MDKLAHFIGLSVFSTPEDDEKKVQGGLMVFLPFDIEKDKIAIKRTSTEGFNGRKIVIMEATLSRQRHIAIFLKNLFSRLTPDQKELLSRQKESRVDENLYFFIRFDKSRLIEDKQLWITDCGSCYHLKIALAPFPRKRELALGIVDELLATGNTSENTDG